MYQVIIRGFKNTGDIACTDTTEINDFAELIPKIKEMEAIPGVVRVLTDIALETRMSNNLMTRPLEDANNLTDDELIRDIKTLRDEADRLASLLRDRYPRNSYEWNQADTLKAELHRVRGRLLQMS